MTRALEILRQVFGYAAYRGFQQDVVEHVAAGGDALVLMPTGGGKSLCYQVPALMRHGTALVVSPLIALMQDQVAALRRRGVAAACLNASLDAPARALVLDAWARGELKLLYVAPERVLTPDFLALLDQRYRESGLNLFAIDEAHCIAEWGYDFRPEYRQLSILGQRYPGIPRLALTATADLATRQDILASLALHHPRLFVGSFDRPNLRYAVVNKTRPWAQLSEFLERRALATAGIVYCPSRKLVEALSRRLCADGRLCLPYHAGLAQEVRADHQIRFLQGEATLMVATMAFGMGVDKPDIRFVVHWAAPTTLESYYQETGRAGRDGFDAEVWMLYDRHDLLRSSCQHPRRVAGIRAMQRYAETEGCRRKVLLAHFGEEGGANCGRCDRCCGLEHDQKRRYNPCPSWSERWGRR